MSSKPNPNDVESIRSILFGEQAAQIDERFEQHDQSLTKLRTELRNLRMALDSELDQRTQADSTLQENIDSRTAELHEKIDALEKNLNQSIAALEKTLREALQNLEEKTDQLAAQIRSELGDLDEKYRLETEKLTQNLQAENLARQAIWNSHIEGQRQLLDGLQNNLQQYQNALTNTDHSTPAD